MAYDTQRRPNVEQKNKVRGKLYKTGIRRTDGTRNEDELSEIIAFWPQKCFPPGMAHKVKRISSCVKCSQCWNNSTKNLISLFFMSTEVNVVSTVVSKLLVQAKVKGYSKSQYCQPKLIWGKLHTQFNRQHTTKFERDRGGDIFIQIPKFPP